MHAYKTELLDNLLVYFNNPSYVALTFFDSGRDEILFILPSETLIQQTHANLMSILSGLPDINQPSERTVISFSDQEGNYYCSHLINPSTQDEIKLALIGYRPQKKIKAEEIKLAYRHLSVPLDNSLS